MTFDELIQIGMLVGTWFAALATFLAVIVALYLSRKVAKIHLKAHAGLRDVFRGDGSPAEEHLDISVTNLGERPVTINSVGWAIGKRKHRRSCIQPVSGPHTSQYPIELAHGKGAEFMVSFLETPNWLDDFATRFVRDRSGKSLKTLVALVHTSVGQTIEVRPEDDLLERLRSNPSPER